jgi:hypothetical protein
MAEPLRWVRVRQIVQLLAVVIDETVKLIDALHSGH